MLLFDSVLCSRPGDGRLDEGVSGLTAGMVSSFRARAPPLALALLLVSASWHVGSSWEQRLHSLSRAYITNDIHTSAIAYARGRAGPSGAGIKLKTGVAVQPLDGAHGERCVRVLRIREGEGGQRHSDCARESESSMSGLARWAAVIRGSACNHLQDAGHQQSVDSPLRQRYGSRLDVCDPARSSRCLAADGRGCARVFEGTIARS